MAAPRPQAGGREQGARGGPGCPSLGWSALARRGGYSCAHACLGHGACARRGHVTPQQRRSRSAVSRQASAPCSPPLHRPLSLWCRLIAGSERVLPRSWRVWTRLGAGVPAPQEGASLRQKAAMGKSTLRGAQGALLRRKRLCGRRLAAHLSWVLRWDRALSACDALGDLSSITKPPGETLLCWRALD